MTARGDVLGAADQALRDIDALLARAPFDVVDLVSHPGQIMVPIGRSGGYQLWVDGGLLDEDFFAWVEGEITRWRLGASALSRDGLSAGKCWRCERVLGPVFESSDACRRCDEAWQAFASDDVELPELPDKAFEEMWQRMHVQYGPEVDGVEGAGCVPYQGVAKLKAA